MKKNETKAQYVGNISYFCILKRFKRFSMQKIFTFILLIMAYTTAFSQDANRQDNSGTRSTDNTYINNNTDSIEISLLTCYPRANVYSLYGHTAIRYIDRSKNIDLAINYGMFSFSKPFFILRFVFGLTDYEMGIEYFDDFARQYVNSGCGVRQQILNLTPQEKNAIAEAIYRNYEPQNRIYRYNYFYDNCTTRARDIIMNHINGKIVFSNNKNGNPSFREMIHKYNERQRWARFGNDLLLGVKADRPTTLKQQQFLPENLMNDFETATICHKDGSKSALVAQSFWVLPQTNSVGNDKFPMSPSECLAIIALIIAVISCIELYKNSIWVIVDIAIMLTTGICGIILFAMIFSKHPTVSLNFQILLLNPFSLVFMWNSIKSLHNRRISLWIKVWILLITLFLIGGSFQNYAEGMYFVALSLLFRYILKTYQFASRQK